MTTAHTTATVTTASGHMWTVTLSNVSAIDDESRTRITDAIVELAARVNLGDAHRVEVTVPDYPGLARI